MLFNSFFSISEVEKINVTLFPLIIYFSLFFNNNSSKFELIAFSIIFLYVSFIEIGLFVGVQLILNSSILHFSIHSFVDIFS